MIASVSGITLRSSTAKEPGAQAVVDIVCVIGDVVGKGRDLGFQRRKTPQFQIEGLVEVGDADGNTAFAIAPGRGPATLGQRAVVLDDALQRFPGQVEPVEFGVAMLQRGHQLQRLGVVVEAAMGLEAFVERPLAGMAERGVAEVVGQRQRFRQVLVEAELPGQGTGDLRHFQRMGQPGAVMIALVEHENLGFVLETAKCGGMDHPVAIPAERAAGLARRFREQPAAAPPGVAGIRARGGQPFRPTRF